MVTAKSDRLSVSRRSLRLRACIQRVERLACLSSVGLADQRQAVSLPGGQKSIQLGGPAWRLLRSAPGAAWWGSLGSAIVGFLLGALLTLAFAAWFIGLIMSARA